MAFADIRIKSLETARECVRLGARRRTIALITGLPPSFILRSVFDDRHRAPRGRPPYTEDLVFRSPLNVQAEIGMFAAKYRRLTGEGLATSQALITAFKHYLSVVRAPSVSFDEAFFLVSNLDGIWAASARTIELGHCRRCGCQHVLPRGAVPAHGCPFCKNRRSVAGELAPERAPTVLSPGTSPAEDELAGISEALELRILAMRRERSLERLGAHRRVVAALTSGPAPPHPTVTSSSLVGTRPIGRPLNLVRWGVAVKTLQRAQYSLVAVAYGRLVAADFGREEALRAAFLHVASTLQTDPALSFDRCFEVAGLFDTRWCEGEPELHLLACSKCQARFLASRRDRAPPHCPFCALIRDPEKYSGSRRPST